jgi:hypothetical protein
MHGVRLRLSGLSADTALVAIHQSVKFGDIAGMEPERGVQPAFSLKIG